MSLVKIYKYKIKPNCESTYLEFQEKVQKIYREYGEIDFTYLKDENDFLKRTEIIRFFGDNPKDVIVKVDSDKRILELFKQFSAEVLDVGVQITEDVLLDEPLALSTISMEEIFSLEKQLHSLEIRSSKDKISKLLADDFIEFGSSGKTWSRDDVLSRLPTEDGRTRIESFNFRANQLTDTLVLVTYISKRISEDTATTEFLRSSIWKLINKEWKMKFHQGTPRAEK